MITERLSLKLVIMVYLSHVEAVFPIPFMFLWLSVGGVFSLGFSWNTKFKILSLAFGIKFIFKTFKVCKNHTGSWD